MSTTKTALILAAWALIVAPIAADAGPADQLEALFIHYDAARRALAADTLDEAPDHALRIVETARAQKLTAVQSAKPRRRDDEPGPAGTLDALAAAGKRLSQAATLEEARTALAELIDALLAYREALGLDDPVVIMCPVDGRRWLQRRGTEVANPYMGVERARCGEVVTFRHSHWLPRVDPAPPIGPPRIPPGGLPR